MADYARTQHVIGSIDIMGFVKFSQHPNRLLALKSFDVDESYVSRLLKMKKKVEHNVFSVWFKVLLVTWGSRQRKP